jgi:hypothetical protein
VPTVLRIGAYRLFFYSSDRNEPRHVHVERDENIAKFWLEPMRLQRSGGFSRTEIRSIERVIHEYHSTIVEAWNEYFGS